MSHTNSTELSKRSSTIINDIVYGPYTDYEPHAKGLGNFIFEACEKYPERICQVLNFVRFFGGSSFSPIHLILIRLSLSPNDLSRRFHQTKGNSIKSGRDNIFSFIFYNAKVNIDMCGNEENRNLYQYEITQRSLSNRNGQKWNPKRRYNHRVTVSCLDPSLSELDANHLLSLVNTKMIFTCSNGRKLIDGVKNANSNLKFEVVSLEDKEFDELLKESPVEQEFRPVEVNAKSVAFILFSSGTTGLPKGIELTHYGIDYGAAVMRLAGIKGDSILHFSSLYWVSAIFLIGLKFQCGGRTVVCKQFDADTVFKTISECKVTYAFIATTFSYKMTSHPDARKYDYSHVHCLTFAGSILSPDQLSKMTDIFKSTYVSSGYGMTELSSFGTLFKFGIEDHLIGSRKSVGTPCHGMSFKICDEHGNTLGSMVHGEIRIKTKSIMAGYHKMTADVFDSDGFICSGDVGYYDEDGCIFIVDRLKDMFKYQDWHIVPSILEGILLQHDGIADAVIFGTPHPQVGHVPTAAIVLKPGFNDVTEENICNFLAEKVIDRQRLRGGVKFIENMPRTPTGKVMRRKIRDMFI